MGELLEKDRMVFLQKRAQRDFILKVKSKLGISNTELAKLIGKNPRTIADWIKERFSMSFISAKKLVKISQIQISSPYSILRWKDHLMQISTLGGKMRLSKYGKITLDETKRLENWKSWWKKKGKYKKRGEGFRQLINIKIPKHSNILAEFIGIMLGDGGVAPYHIHITLSSKERQYALFICSLFQKLFNITPKVRTLKHAKAVSIVAQRKQLVDFCIRHGLVIGNKVRQQVDIPLWIKNNSTFAKACVRGLIDTDGCFYKHTYHVATKPYSYKKIAFTNSSSPLLVSVHEILKINKITSSISSDRKHLRITGIKDVKRYLTIFSTHNAKHKERIK